MSINTQRTTCWTKECESLRKDADDPTSGEPVRYPADGNRILEDIEKDSFWYRHRNEVLLAGISGYKRLPEGIFLEVGAGNGFVSAAIRDSLQLKVACLEPDPNGVAAIRRKGIEDVICSSFRETLVAPKSVGCVGIFDVLEHVKDEKNFLGLAKDALVDNGKLILTVPAYLWLWSIEDEHDGHIRRYTKHRLYRLLHSTGFSVDYATYFFAFLPLPILLYRTLPSVLHLGSMKSVVSYKINREKHYARDHAVGRVWRKVVTRCLFSWELGLIRRRFFLPFGGSIMVLATKA